MSAIWFEGTPRQALLKVQRLLPYLGSRARRWHCKLWAQTTHTGPATHTGQARRLVWTGVPTNSCTPRVRQKNNWATPGEVYPNLRHTRCNISKPEQCGLCHAPDKAEIPNPKPERRFGSSQGMEPRVPERQPHRQPTRLD